MPLGGYEFLETHTAILLFFFMAKEILCLVHISLECMQMVKQGVFEASPLRVTGSSPVIPANFLKDTNSNYYTIDNWYCGR